jgi:hypothetical protein
MFFDVDLHRKEILVDVGSCLLVIVRFGIQPSATTSLRRRAEVQQDRFSQLLRFRERCIYVFAPLHTHTHSGMLRFKLDLRFRWDVFDAL